MERWDDAMNNGSTAEPWARCPDTEQWNDAVVVKKGSVGGADQRGEDA